ncbi:MAG: hypothetical protein OEM04_06460 [Flavobacteriaceae bacterium]|nr:hypothetical protein [Flavobacteriaceae bacterium]
MSINLKPLLAVLVLLSVSELFAQQYASTRVRDKHSVYKDSLKQVEYNYIFPIWGQKAYSKGFDLPYPAGIMGNFLWMDQGIIVENLQLGLKTDELDVPLTPIEFIEFGDNSNSSYTVNVRPDLWVLPFLNVYGIFGYGNSTTRVNVTVPIELQSTVEQGIQTSGFGIMGAGGIGPVWFSIDANWTWNKPELLEKAVQVNVMGFRIGHTFTFKNNPDSNLALWAGGMRVEMGSETVGEIQLIDVLSPEAWERRDEIVGNYYEWYENEATPAQKIAADKVLTPIVERIEAADGSSIISYGMDKRVKEKWNGVFGAQYQLNKRWMLRTEAGIIGDRKSFLVSLNYRFLL